jgi:hypothetical protein
MNLREDAIVELIERFFAERVFGEPRLRGLAGQADSPVGSNPDRDVRERLDEELADLDSAISAQVRGLEAGVDARLVQRRIEELKAQRVPREAALSVLPPDVPSDWTRLAKCLAALPDLREQSSWVSRPGAWARLPTAWGSGPSRTTTSPTSSRRFRTADATCIAGSSRYQLLDLAVST